MEELIDDVIIWAKDKGLLNSDYKFSQFAKTVEELGELAKAIIIDDKEEQIDAIGDVTVTLIILAEQLGLDYKECLEKAYNVIKHRKGNIKNGSFVRQGE